jgi:hypothetical protein
MRYEILNEQGEVTNVIMASPEFMQEHYPEGNYRLVEEPVIEQHTWKITKLAFKNRFPRNKWIAAKMASASDPILGDFFETFELSTLIDLQRQDTIASVNALKDESIPESFRLIQEEVDAVLLVPAQTDEIPS